MNHTRPEIETTTVIVKRLRVRKSLLTKSSFERLPIVSPMDEETGEVVISRADLICRVDYQDQYWLIAFCGGKTVRTDGGFANARPDETHQKYYARVLAAKDHFAALVAFAPRIRLSSGQ